MCTISQQVVGAFGICSDTRRCPVQHGPSTQPVQQPHRPHAGASKGMLGILQGCAVLSCAGANCACLYCHCSRSCTAGFLIHNLPQCTPVCLMPQPRLPAASECCCTAAHIHAHVLHALQVYPGAQTGVCNAAGAPGTPAPCQAPNLLPGNGP
jgi:hypothetical protein